MRSRERRSQRSDTVARGQARDAVPMAAQQRDCSDLRPDQDALITLVRILARQAARDLFAAELEKQLARPAKGDQRA